MMPAENRTPSTGEALGEDETVKATNLNSNYHTPTSIRRRFGTGISGYESAKFAWIAANPGADHRQFEAAMRRIVRAVKV